MTNQTSTPEPDPAAPQPNTLRQRLLDGAATVLSIIAVVLDLTDHQPLAVAARATAIGVRWLNTVLDTRGLPPHDGPRP